METQEAQTRSSVETQEAQEIEKVLPEVVRTNEHGVKSVNESPLTWYMINAIKELSAKNDALAAEVEQLKSQLNN